VNAPELGPCRNPQAKWRKRSRANKLARLKRKEAWTGTLKFFFQTKPISTSNDQSESKKGHQYSSRRRRRGIAKERNLCIGKGMGGTTKIHCQKKFCNLRGNSKFNQCLGKTSKGETESKVKEGGHRGGGRRGKTALAKRVRNCWNAKSNLIIRRRQTGGGGEVERGEVKREKMNSRLTKEGKDWGNKKPSRYDDCFQPQRTTQPRGLRHRYYQ